VPKYYTYSNGKWNVIVRQAKAQWAVVPMEEEEEELYV